MDEQDGQDITEGGLSSPPIRRGDACVAHLFLDYANGVELQSPASHSARWVTNHTYYRTPTGFHKRRQLGIKN